jgi:RNA polymerase sigma-70 factor (ECF subfamily)
VKPDQSHQTDTPRHAVDDAEGAVGASGEPRSEMLARLFREHNQELIGFLCTRLRSEQDAKEVAQEAYARLLRLDQPDAAGFLRAYLFKTAANLAIDRLRHRSTRDAVHRNLDSGEEQADHATPEKMTANSQEAGLVLRYLNELPERCRRAFLLYRVYEFSLQDVATRMGVTDRMVRYYVMQAMTHVQRRLESPSAPAKELLP